jgi:hypothetical protein
MKERDMEAKKPQVPPEAVEAYNKFAEKEAVGGLFHTTC